MPVSGLSFRTTAAASVEPTPGGGFILRVPAGSSRGFRLAQLDDCGAGRRADFRWSPPLTLSLRARLTSGSDYAGTWGFGFWNDPFSLSLGIRGSNRRLPAFPNAAWFFYASRPNHLSLRDDKPGDGFLAATFASPAVPSLVLAPALLGVPLLAWKRVSRLLRRRIASIVRGDAHRLDQIPAQWANYSLSWEESRVTFSVDELAVFETDIAPRRPLGLVIWMDNQYAAWRPDGGVAAGVLAGESASMEVEELQILKAGRA